MPSTQFWLLIPRTRKWPQVVLALSFVTLPLTCSAGVSAAPCTPNWLLVTADLLGMKPAQLPDAFTCKGTMVLLKATGATLAALLTSQAKALWV
jgi:hypothetical protein